MRMILIFLLACSGSAFTTWQSGVIREMLTKYNASTTIVVDRVSYDVPGSTRRPSDIVYIDGESFQGAPRTFVNTVHHELAHAAHKRDHNNIPCDIMSYHLTTNNKGIMLDDTFIVPDVAADFGLPNGAVLPVATPESMPLVFALMARTVQVLTCELPTSPVVIAPPVLAPPAPPVMGPPVMGPLPQPIPLSSQKNIVGPPMMQPIVQPTLIRRVRQATGW
jgi:hypothetical protein